MGDLIIRFDNKTVLTQPLYALEAAPKGGFYTRMKDSVKLTFRKWFGA